MEDEQSEEDPSYFDEILNVAKLNNPQLYEFIKQYLPSNAQTSSEDRGINAKPLIDAIKSCDFEAVENEIIKVKEAGGLDIPGANNPLGHAIIADNTQIVGLLLQSGADINFKPIRVASAIIEVRSPKMLKFLAKNGADLNLGTVNGQNLLVQRIEQSDIAFGGQKQDENISMIKAFAEYFDIDEPCQNLTPLMRAVISENYDIVKALLDLGAEPNITTKKRETALSIAIDKGYEDIAVLLRSRGATEVAFQS